MMRRICTHLVLLLILMLMPQVDAQTPLLRIKYISVEEIYIDGGRDHGLQLQDTLEVRRDDRLLGRLLVTSLADKSASCRLLEKFAEPRNGDPVVLTSKLMRPQDAASRLKGTAASGPEALPARPAASSRAAALHGTLSLQYYRWDDKSPSNFDFSQPTARVNLKIARLAIPYLQFTLRTRGRYDKRSAGYPDQVAQKEWRNRLYQCYFDYNNPSAWVNAKIGRIITDPLSGIGYIDGLMANLNWSSAIKTGILAGYVPEWQYADFQTSIRKYGAFAVYRNGSASTPVFETTLAVAGEYHGATTSREFLYWQNQFNWRHRLWLYQNIEVDFNRDWRREKTGRSLDLSGLYLNGQYAPFSWMTVGLNVDSRKNYWTYEYRTISDSLFDDFTRRGVRTQLHFFLPGRQQITTSVGLRKREIDTQPTYSFTLNYRNMSILQTGWEAGFYTAGFSSPLYNGLSFDLNVGRELLGVLYLNARYGLSTYHVQGASSRMNHQMQFNGSVNVSRHLFFNVMYEQDSGDDEKGRRSWIEIGSRF